MGSRWLAALIMAASTAGAALPPSAVRAESAKAGWTEIPTRISGVTMQYRSLGCKQELCSIEVDTNIPGGANYNETINCSKQEIQTVMAGKPGPWLRIDKGSVDETKFHAVCHKH